MAQLKKYSMSGQEDGQVCHSFLHDASFNIVLNNISFLSYRTILSSLAVFVGFSYRFLLIYMLAGILQGV